MSQSHLSTFVLIAAITKSTSTIVFEAFKMVLNIDHRRFSQESLPQ